MYRNEALDSYFFAFKPSLYYENYEKVVNVTKGIKFVGRN